MFLIQRSKIFTFTLLSVFVLLCLALARDTKAATSVSQTLPLDRPVFRIETTDDGIHEVSYTDLAQAGMNMSQVNPNNIAMMYRGESVAYEFVGDNDNSFETNETVRFYAWEFDGPKSEKRYVKNQSFWLWADDTAQRVETVSNPAAGYTQATNFRENLVFEGNNDVFDPTQYDHWDEFEADEWYWARFGYYFFDGDVDFDTNGDGITDQTVSFTAPRYQIDIPSPTLSSDVVEFSAEFLTKVFGTYDVTVQLGNGIAPKTWKQQDYVSIEGTTTNSWLLDGDNVLTISGQSWNNDGLPGTQEGYSLDGDYSDKRVWFNELHVSYMRDMVAKNNQLLIDWADAGNHEFLIEGFTESSASNAIVWDTTDRLNPKSITLSNSDITAVAGNYQWRVSAANGTGQVLATSASNIKDAVAIEKYEGSSITPSGGAEWVAISHGDFIASTEELATYRALSSNVKTHVVVVEVIINQYGYGFNTPQAIRDYMTNAYSSWSTQPEYLTLVGDAAWNVHNQSCPICGDAINVAEETYVVTDLQFFDRHSGMIPTDHTYSMLDGDDIIPDIAVGRLPVKTSAEADAIVNKIKIYENAIRTNASWINDILFLADDNDDAGNFCDVNNDMVDNNLQAWAGNAYTYQELCLDDYIADAAGAVSPTATGQINLRGDLFDIMENEGRGITNYRGHGSVQYWASNFLTADTSGTRNDMERWNNSNQPTVILSADCLDADFARNGRPGLGESFLKLENAGTVAHWGSTGLGYDSDHTILYNGFYEGLTTDASIQTIGEAAQYSKNYFISEKVGNVDIAFTSAWTDLWGFTLLGDPAMKMPTPEALAEAAAANVDLVDNSLAASNQSGSVRVEWQSTAEPGVVTYLVQRATSPSGFSNYETASLSSFVGQATATGSNSSGGSYSIIDSNGLQDGVTYYYRIITVDSAGQRQLITSDISTVSVPFSATGGMNFIMLPILVR